jgi:hypothetical protein
MPKSHPPYPPVFRRQIVRLVRAGRSPEELAQEFEPTAQAIRSEPSATGILLANSFWTANQYCER